MRILILACCFQFISLSHALAQTDSATSTATLVTDSVENGCGLSDPTYDNLASRLSEKSKVQYPMRSKGPETGRRLYIFSDNSWFLTLEFFNADSTGQDVSCVVDHGSAEESQRSIDYILTDYPEWKWGQKPENWPPAKN